MQLLWTHYQVQVDKHDHFGPSRPDRERESNDYTTNVCPQQLH